MFLAVQFWIAICVLLLVHNFLPAKAQNLLLLIASYAFYAYWDPKSVWLLAVSSGLTFVIARQFGSEKSNRRLFLWIGILLNIGILVIFKIAILGVESNLTDFIFPLGISFYVFRLLSYEFDSYHGRISSTNVSLLDFALYVSFFPQIVSGPIERAPRFLPELKKTRRLSQEQIANGITHILIGLFYKLVISNTLTSFIATLGQLETTSRSLSALGIITLYGLQLYTDFAGYTAIAVGISAWFGLPATENFRQPYFAHSIVDFWTRWHISLSTWLRDYLFYPLSRYLLKRSGGKYKSAIQATAYITTMLSIGIWHGFNWTFAVWGLLHGLYMTIESLASNWHKSSPKAGPNRPVWRWTGLLLSIVVTQLLVTFAWIFFRAGSIAEAITFAEHLFSFGSTNSDLILIWSRALPILVAVVAIDLMQIRMEGSIVLWRLRLGWQVVFWAVLLMCLLLFKPSTPVPFVYSGF